MSYGHVVADLFVLPPPHPPQEVAYYRRARYGRRAHRAVRPISLMSTSRLWRSRPMGLRPNGRYTVFTGYILHDRYDTSPTEMRRRIKSILPFDCVDYGVRTSEECREVDDPFLGWGGPADSFDDRLYYMMQHDPESVASLVRKLTGRW